MKKLTAKQILKNFNWKVEIRTQWLGKKIEKDVLLPSSYQELIEKLLQEHINSGKDVFDNTYTSLGGSEKCDVEMLVKHIQAFKRKYAGKLRTHIDEYNKFPISVHATGDDGDEGCITIRGKIEYDKNYLINYAQREFARYSYQYKQEYDTMIRIQNTEKII
jgi:hypothetical protein